jgi:hypothetical protein
MSEFPDYEDQIEDFDDAELDRLWSEAGVNLSWNVEHSDEGPHWNFDDAVAEVDIEER